MLTTRRDLIGASAGALALAGLARVSARADGEVDAWRPGPYLLLDRALVASVSGLSRRSEPPSRLPDPIVTGYEDGCFQPYLTVVRDPDSGRFRIWYGVPRTPGNAGESSLATMESDDGIHWERPHRVLRDPAPIQFGCSVIDEGPGFPEPAHRYRYGWWKDGGLRVAASPDGLEWTPLSDDVVLPMNHDIVSIHRDPIRAQYLALGSIVSPDGPRAGLRIPHQSVSDDLLHWETPRPIVTPDPEAEIERGETQFYSMSGVLARGELLVGLVKVLREDLNCEPDKTAAELHDPDRAYAGLGYTVVAWSRDGRTWERETEPFLDRNPTPDTWDRAMAWGDDQVIVGDHVSIYYGGYRWGHKAERFTTRQIGYAHMPLDRYVGYAAEGEPGTLRTEPRRLGEAVQLRVNARVDLSSGSFRARATDPADRPYPGFDWEDCRPMVGDRIDHPVAWRGTNADLAGKEVRFEFEVTRGAVYAFEVC